MGKLQDLIIRTTEVPAPGGGSLTIRGLAFEDFWTLAQDHGPEATMLFSRVVNQERFEDTDIRAIFTGLLPQIPKLVGAAIALANDDYVPDSVDMARKLPPRVQLDALEAIFIQTIESEAELKKFMESILRMLTGARRLMEQMRLPLSEVGFGEFDAK